MDVLSDVLGSLRLQSGVFVHSELVAPWGMCAVGQPHVAFHIVLRGSCWLDVDGRPPAQVSVGDVVLVGPGIGHALRDAPGTPVRPVEELIAAGAFAPRMEPRERAGSYTHLVCGMFRFEDDRAKALLSALPPLIHLGDTSGVGPWIEHTIKLVGYESAAHQPGADVVINRLCDALFVYAVRTVIAEGAIVDASWLRGLADPRIGTAMRLIHEAPAHPWTLETLARRATMSRSAFAARFLELVGDTPVRYLTSWRLQKAATRLRQTDTPIAEIAADVGYESEPAFNKAFKRMLGTTPGAYRRSSHDAVR